MRSRDKDTVTIGITLLGIILCIIAAVILNEPVEEPKEQEKPDTTENPIRKGLALNNCTICKK